MQQDLLRKKMEKIVVSVKLTMQREEGQVPVKKVMFRIGYQLFNQELFSCAPF